MEEFTYYSLLKQQKYRRLLFSNLINRLGDAIDTLAFSWIVYAFTGEGMWAAIIFAINKVPSFIVLPFAGAYVEKLEKKRTLIICDTIRCFLVIVFLIAVLTEQLSIIILVLFTFFISLAEAFRMPASTAFLTQTLNKETLDRGVTLNVAASTIVEMIGVALGGVFITHFGVHIAIVVDAATFIISIVFILMIPHVETIDEYIKMSDNWSLLKSGLVYIKSCGVLVSTIIMAVLANAAMSPIDSLQTVVVVDIFHREASYLSVLNICLSIGMFLGGMLYPTIKTHVKEDKVLFRFAFFFIAFLYFVTALLGFVEVLGNAITITYCGLYFLYGIFASFLAVGLGVRLLENVGQSYMARVNTWYSAISAASTPAVAAFVGLLTRYLSIPLIYILVAAIIIIALCLSFLNLCEKI